MAGRTRTGPDDVVGELRATYSELQRRGFALPERYEDFVRRHNPDLLRYEHIPRTCDVVDRVVRGEIKRLLVIEPPRYFKSEMFSRLLGAYWTRQMPHQWAAIISYAADMAWELSEDARGYYVADGGVLRRDSGAKRRWRTVRGGGLWAYGVGGQLLGRGYKLAIVDDPVDPEKAWSPTYQRRFREWWPAKFISRQEPDARIIVVMQRLGLDDPIDFLLRREVGDGTDCAPEHWHVLFLDEIKSDEPIGRWDGPMGLPPTCTLEPDPRPLGAVLAPSRFNANEVKRLQTAAGPLVTSAQRQGRPMRPAGDFWKEAWFRDRIYDELPASAYNGGTDWDTAYTKNELNSASAFVRSFRGPGKDGEFPIYIDEVDWDWLEFPALIERMRSVAGPHYVEDKAAGKSSVQALRAENITAFEVKVHGDKFARAAAVQSVVANRRVWVRRSVFQSLLYGERQGLLRVSAERLQEDGPDLDLNDAFVQALTRHVGLYGRRLVFGSR